MLVAPPARLELTTFRLGGDRSIQLSYGGLYRKYSLLQGSRIRTIQFLGGGPSILVRYGGIYETLAFCEQADSRFFQKAMAETYLRRGSIRLSY